MNNIHPSSHSLIGCCPPLSPAFAAPPYLSHVLVGLTQLTLHHPHRIRQHIPGQPLHLALEGGREEQRLSVWPDVITY